MSIVLLRITKAVMARSWTTTDRRWRRNRTKCSREMLSNSVFRLSRMLVIRRRWVNIYNMSPYGCCRRPEVSCRWLYRFDFKITFFCLFLSWVNAAQKFGKPSRWSWLVEHSLLIMTYFKNSYKKYTYNSLSSLMRS